MAVAFLGAFGIDALDEQRMWRHRLAVHTEDAQAFAQEVRRLAPFVPALVAKASVDQNWGGHRVRRGERVLLDVPAVNRDPETWSEPDVFDPGRFLGRQGVWPFDMVPQGGGEPTGHRCPGEPLTTSLLTMTLRAVASREEWTAVAGAHDRTRIPARPDTWLRR